MTARDYVLSAPEKVDNKVLEGLDSRFHLEMEGEGGGQFTLVVHDSKLEVVEGLVGEPTCRVEVSSKNFMKLLKGEMNPLMALMTGKVKISNKAELMKYAKIFGLM